MPLAIHLVQMGYTVKGSTTNTDKLETMRSNGVLPFVINLSQRNYEATGFLDAEVLIIAVPSKNVNDFKNLITEIEKSPVKKVLFISSTSVYPNTNDIVTETSEVLDSPLVEIENLFRNSSVFESCIIRFAGLFGYDRKPGNFYPSGHKISNPDGSVNFIHRDDCLRIIMEIIEKNIWQETFNACADTHPKRREFFTKEALRLGLVQPKFKEESSCDYKIVSNAKLKGKLNFSFKYPDVMNYEE
ncbi:MAG: NAD-dependent epimerase/dehydratase family protein [Bacteroidetes bacterium]|nr:NAD-dependent epimerase/dehydratase family protein [Bacteroidota bacterium]